MFTGIIETIATIQEIRRGSRSITLGIVPDMQPFVVEIGGSVAVDGACLTLESRTHNCLYFTAVAETLERTTISKKLVGARVNLERALPAAARLDGHIVLGHVDAIGTIQADKRVGDSVVRTIAIPGDIMPHVAEKGSVAIDGISLTVADAPLSKNIIAISFILFTYEKTTMALKHAGDSVNIECDVVSRYLSRILACKSPSSNDGATLLNTMERLGF